MFTPTAQVEYWIGCGIAFAVAITVVGFDCYNNVQSSLQRTTVAVYRIPVVYLVLFLCGSLASIAYVASIVEPTNWVNQALSLGVTNNIVRGFAIGTSVLVLIRSKVLKAGSSNIGGEYFYNLGQVAILRSASRRRARDRDLFLTASGVRMMAIEDFETEIVEFVREFTKTDPESVRKALEDQLKDVQGKRPAAAFALENQNWRRYYRSLAGVAADFCGADEMNAWVGQRQK